MQDPGAHIDLNGSTSLNALVTAFAQLVAKELAATMVAIAPPATGAGPALEPPLNADGFYTAEDLALRWRLVRKDGSPNREAVYAISEIELPRRRIGSGRGRSLFYGLDILRYEGTLTEDQYHAVQEAKLALLEDPPQKPTRVRRLGHALHQDRKQTHR